MNFSALQTYFTRYTLLASSLFTRVNSFHRKSTAMRYDSRIVFFFYLKKIFSVVANNISGNGNGPVVSRIIAVLTFRMLDGHKNTSSVEVEIRHICIEIFSGNWTLYAILLHKAVVSFFFTEILIKL